MSCHTQSMMDHKEMDQMKKVEPMLEYLIADNKLTAKVHSTGCTKKEDFKLELLNNTGNCQIKVYRIKPDFCKKMPFPVTITLPIQDADQCKGIELLNSLVQSGSR